MTILDARLTRHKVLLDFALSKRYRLDMEFCWWAPCIPLAYLDGYRGRGYLEAEGTLGRAWFAIRVRPR